MARRGRHARRRRGVFDRLDVYAQLGGLAREGHACAWSTRITAWGAEEVDVIFESGEGLDLAPEIEPLFDCLDTGRTPETDERLACNVIALVLEAYRKADGEGANV